MRFFIRGPAEGHRGESRPEVVQRCSTPTAVGVEHLWTMINQGRNSCLFDKYYIFDIIAKTI